MGKHSRQGVIDQYGQPVYDAYEMPRQGDTYIIVNAPQPTLVDRAADAWAEWMHSPVDPFYWKAWAFLGAIMHGSVIYEGTWVGIVTEQLGWMRRDAMAGEWAGVVMEIVAFVTVFLGPFILAWILWLGSSPERFYRSALLRLTVNLLRRLYVFLILVGLYKMVNGNNQQQPAVGVEHPARAGGTALRNHRGR